MVNRAEQVNCEVRRYLEKTLYPNPSEPLIVSVNRGGGSTVLEVRVDVDNLFPELLSAWISAIPGAGGFAAPERIIFTATGEYEDPDEATTEDNEP